MLEIDVPLIDSTHCELSPNDPRLVRSLVAKMLSGDVLRKIVIIVMIEVIMYHGAQQMITSLLQRGSTSIGFLIVGSPKRPPQMYLQESS